MRGPSFAPFRIRVFALFWAGSFVSNIGTIMEQFALGYYVQQRTGQAAWNGTVAALGFLPVALLGPVGGVLADRVSRRRLLMGSTGVSLILAAIMTAVVATQHGAPVIIALISFLTGCASAIGFPAFQSMLPDLVPADQLVAAIGLSTAQWNLARVVAPALAAVTVAVAGVATALAINTVSFLAVMAVLLVVHLPAPSGATAGLSIRDATARAWRYARRDPALRVTTTLAGMNSFFGSAYIGLIPAMARKVHHGGAVLTGWLATAMGLGAVTAALSLGSLVGRLGVRRVLLGASAALPLATVLYALAPGRGAALVTLAVLAFCYMSALSSVTSVTQLRAPAELRGRLIAVNTVILGLAYPAAVTLQGKLGDLFGLRRAILVFGLAHAAVLIGYRVRRPGFWTALDDPAGDPTLVAVPAG